MTSVHEQYSHDADIGIRGRGSSLASAFEQAALALTEVILDPTLIRETDSVSVECEHEDPEILFYNWINAIVYEMSIHKMVFSRFKVKIEKGRLTASMYGESCDIKRHQPTVEIKGATFTTLKVAQLDSGDWVAQTVVDV